MYSNGSIKTTLLELEEKPQGRHMVNLSGFLEEERAATEAHMAGRDMVDSSFIGRNEMLGQVLRKAHSGEERKTAGKNCVHHHSAVPINFTFIHRVELATG